MDCYRHVVSRDASGISRGVGAMLDHQPAEKMDVDCTLAGSASHKARTVMSGCAHLVTENLAVHVYGGCCNF